MSNDAIAAMYQEVNTLHHDLITRTPVRLREKRPFALDDMDGELIARSSRILEPYTLDILDSVVPERGAYHLLEVGCGSRVYIRRACLRNPDLQAVGLELQPKVADVARKNLQAWGLAERGTVETGDIRNYASPERFYLVTLHNNIYYFPIPERLDLLRRLATFLNPGGKLLVTTACKGFQVTQMLHPWAEMTAGAGALPERDALCDLMVKRVSSLQEQSSFFQVGASLLLWAQRARSQGLGQTRFGEELFSDSNGRPFCFLSLENRGRRANARSNKVLKPKLRDV